MGERAALWQKDAAPGWDSERMRLELILNFHGIGTPPDGVNPREAAMWMGVERFVALLDYIAAPNTAGPAISITFDDGNASDVAIALPELRRRRLKATFFLCAGRLDATGYVSRAGVGALVSAGMEIGSHGMHHQDWCTLGEDALGVEIGAARHCLEEACRMQVTAVAIPFGAYDRRVLARLRSAGFARVYTSDRGLCRPTAWVKPRNTLGAAASQDDVAALRSTKYWPQQILLELIRLYKGLR
jgi:peptidoglycan/xylan/chitin deacetylase (PgdA/CDA1 family)